MTLFFVIIGRVKRITQPAFVPNKRECRELVNLKRAFPPLKRSISYAPRHRPPQILPDFIILISLC
jgi:hypothetical protein